MFNNSVELNEVITREDNKNINKKGIDISRIKRGEIIWVELDYGIDGDTRLKGNRPCVAIANQKCLDNSYAITVAPVTSSYIKMNKEIGTHVTLQEGDGVKRVSTVLCEQLSTIDKDMILSVNNGYVSELTMKKIEKAIMVQVGINLEKVEEKIEDVKKADYDYIDALASDCIESIYRYKEHKDDFFMRLYKTSKATLKQYCKEFKINEEQILKEKMNELMNNKQNQKVSNA